MNAGQFLSLSLKEVPTPLQHNFPKCVLYSTSIGTVIYIYIYFKWELLSSKKPTFFLEDLFDVQEIESLQERVQKTDFPNKFQHETHFTQPLIGMGFNQSHAGCCH